MISDVIVVVDASQFEFSLFSFLNHLCASCNICLVCICSCYLFLLLFWFFVYFANNYKWWVWPFFLHNPKYNVCLCIEIQMRRWCFGDEINGCVCLHAAHEWNAHSFQKWLSYDADCYINVVCAVWCFSCSYCWCCSHCYYYCYAIAWRMCCVCFTYLKKKILLRTQKAAWCPFFGRKHLLWYTAQYRQTIQIYKMQFMKIYCTVGLVFVYKCVCAFIYV